MESNTVREHYNKDVSSRAGNAYEFDRWHKTPIARAGYEMTKKGLLREFLELKPNKCFELGPGAGTWTNLLIETFPNINIDVFDISSHMLSMAKENIKNKNVKFIEGDFDMYKGEEGSHDLFFSSRVFEYLPDQKKAVNTIFSILSPQGHGIISTKYPRGVHAAELHKGIVHPIVFRKMLKEVGFKDISIKPLTMTVPFFKSATLNKLVFLLLGSFPISIIHAPFCESYVVHFSKS